jgi:sirohydrochlorin cobaltochelatase
VNPASILVAMTALVLFSHGSLLCGSGEALEAHAARLKDRALADRVAIGYLNYSDPLFGDVVDQLVSEGVGTVIVVPYFLAPGYFVTHSLPEALEPVRERHPEVTFQVAPVLGEDPRWDEIVVATAQTARSSEHWDEPLARAGSHCRNRSDCPLFSTDACPATRVGGIA